MATPSEDLATAVRVLREHAAMLEAAVKQDTPHKLLQDTAALDASLQRRREALVGSALTLGAAASYLSEALWLEEQANARIKA